MQLYPSSLLHFLKRNNHEEINYKDSFNPGANPFLDDNQPLPAHMTKDSIEKDNSVHLMGERDILTLMESLLTIWTGNSERPNQLRRKVSRTSKVTGFMTFL